MAVKTDKASARPSTTTASGIEVRLDRLFALGHYPLAVCSATIGPFVVHGMEVVGSKKGPFVQMPQVSYKKQDQTFYKDIFHPITAEARQELYGAVMQLYEQARAEEQQESDEAEAESDSQNQGPAM